MTTDNMLQETPNKSGSRGVNGLREPVPSNAVMRKKEFDGLADDDELRAGDSPALTDDLSSSDLSSPVQGEDEIFLAELEQVACFLLALKSGSPMKRSRRMRPSMSSKKHKSDSSLVSEEEEEEEEVQENQGSPEEEEDEDHEEYMVGEVDDDDEWFDGQGIRTSSSPSTSRAFRKKAPSGAACDKHKRWKKRCPDDCPMRSAEYKNAGSSSPNESNQNSSNEMEFDEEEFDEQAHEEESNERTEQSYEEFLQEFEKMKQMKLQMKQMNQSLQSSSSFSPSSSFDFLRSAAAKSNKKRFYGGNTIACEQHTLLHARCPPNCPERRPAKPHPRSKKGKSDKPESRKSFETDNFEPLITSAISSPVMMNHNENLISPIKIKKSPETIQSPPSKRKTIQRSQSYDEDDLEDSLYEDEDFRSSSSRRFGNMVRSTSSTSIKKSTSGNNRAGRTGRKYLPSACERHKLLHARCPANCPDRIARDTDRKDGSDAGAEDTGPMSESQ